MKWNFCYLTRNKVNNMIYFGKHSTDDIHDGYIGSGVRLRKAVNKYGKDNFEVVNRWFFDTSEQAYLYESKIVDQVYIDRADTYNVALGGWGSDPVHVETHRMMTNDIVTKYVHPDEITTYIADGFRMGRHTSAAHEKANNKRHQHMSDYEIRHPDGTITHVTNQAKFARDHGLSAPHLTRLCKGELGSVRGYTLVGSTYEYVPKGKRVVTPDGIFDTTGKAGAFYSVKYQTIQYRINSNGKKWEGWHYE